MIETSSHVGPTLKALRKGANLTLKQLSAKCGYSITHLSEMENQKSCPTVGTLERVTGALEVPLSEFFWLIEDQFKEAKS